MISLADFIGYAAGWSPPDTGTIIEWCEKHVELPRGYAMPGRFRIGQSTYLTEPLLAMQDKTVREITVRAGIQTGKSLIADLSIPWILCNDPGPVMWTWQTDDDAKEHWHTRFYAMLKLCKPLLPLLPNDRTALTTCNIYFGDYYLILNGCNLANLQGKSIRWKINSELWMQPWQGKYIHAAGRVTKFEEVGTSKILNESQAGVQGDEIDKRYQASSQGVWCVDCGHGHHPLSWRIEAPDGSTAGVIWDEVKRGDGEIDIEATAATVRYKCPIGGTEMPDTPVTRLAWAKTGRYEHKGSSKIHLGFHYPSHASRPMGLMLREYISAREYEKRGDIGPMREFYQKRLAVPYIEKPVQIIDLSQKSGYTVADYADGSMVPNEKIRFMTIDKQKGHWWVEVSAYCNDGSRMQLYFGKTMTVSENRELQDRYKVKSRCVAQDAQYMPAEVFDDCTRYGWVAMEGSRLRGWRHELDAADPNTGKNYRYEYFSPPTRIDHVGRSCYRISFSANNCKDIMSRLVQNHEMWKLPDDVNPEYLEHMRGEKRSEVKPGEWGWTRIPNRENHGWDTSNMSVALALMAGALKPPQDILEPPEG